MKGDATAPAGEGPKLLLHVCNDIGSWGSGFVLAVSRRWPEPEAAYRQLGSQGGYRLGQTQLVEVEKDLWVVNMIGQHGIRKKRGKSEPPIRYEAIRHALREVAFHAKLPLVLGPYKSASIHCPKFGAGLAGGDWQVIEQLILEELVDKGLDVTVYEFDG